MHEYEYIAHLLTRCFVCAGVRPDMVYFGVAIGFVVLAVILCVLMCWLLCLVVTDK